MANSIAGGKTPTREAVAEKKATAESGIKVCSDGEGGREVREDGSYAGGRMGDDDEANGEGYGSEANRALAQTSKGGKCAHGRERYRCKECGGAGICAHGRQRHKCKQCGGASICQHGRERYMCTECGGAGNCDHGRQRCRCTECRGASICEHGKRRRRCKQCRILLTSTLAGDQL